jgi:hypothetical protein
VCPPLWSLQNSSSHTDQTGGVHRSDRYPLVRSVWPTSQTGLMLLHLLLQSWLCGSTKEPSGFLVNQWKPHGLGVASANNHSWLGSYKVPTQPWFWGSTKKSYTTSSCCSCHHAAHTWPRWPLGPSNQAYLSSPHLDASPTMTFRACSSPALTPVKSQPAPAILRQLSVHTTLSITHSTNKRPSTGPRTTQVLNLPLDECIDNKHICITKEKRKRK